MTEKRRENIDQCSEKHNGVHMEGEMKDKNVDKERGEKTRIKRQMEREPPKLRITEQRAK